jgi:hypothetical protein
MTALLPDEISSRYHRRSRSAPKVFDASADAFGATRIGELVLPEADLANAAPELPEMLLQTVDFLAAVQERLVTIMPATVRLQ